MMFYTHTHTHTHTHTNTVDSILMYCNSISDVAHCKTIFVAYFTVHTVYLHYML